MPDNSKHENSIHCMESEYYAWNSNTILGGLSNGKSLTMLVRQYHVWNSETMLSIHQIMNQMLVCPCWILPYMELKYHELDFHLVHPML